jgi:hypothetical protein
METLNINIFQKSDGTGNFPDNQETRDALNQIILWVNGIYNVCDPCDPIPDVQELGVTNIKFSIGELGNERIYFYQNDQIWNSSSTTTLLNEVISVDPDRSNYINVLISGGTGNYASASMPDYSNLNKNHYVFMFTWTPVLKYAKANGLAHELGHNLALFHTYYGGGANAECDNNNEYLSDVFGTWPGNCPHIGPPNIWGEDACEFPDDRKTNNLMGGNMSNCYISPKQAGQMHRAIALTSARRFVEKTYSNIPLVINSNEIWDFDIRLYRDIIIETGVELTLKCNLIMPFDGKIIIKQGAKLVVDGAKITTIDEILWQGIEVWGTYNKSQYLEDEQYYQGTLIIKNNSIIENSKSAVELWKSGDNLTTGGIVQATNSTFRNNARSVKAILYNNYNPNVPGHPVMDNVSYFKNCTFEITNNYFPELDFYEHALLAKVKGIKFIACDFSVVQTEGVFTYNRAIFSSSAGFSISALCSSSVLPCTDYDKCAFTGFYQGIIATNDGTNTNTFNVNRAVFTDNSYGISVSNIHNAAVLFSEFNIGYNTADQEKCEGKGSGYGIDMTGCTGFAIEENKFKKAQGVPLGNYIGIRVNGCPSESDNIYLNEFLALSEGNLAQGTNRSNPGDDSKGVAYLCNQNFYNSYDFHIARNSMIRGNMGGVTSPSGNVLTYPPVSIMQFQNDGTQNVEYFYNVNKTDEWLTKYTSYVTSIPINYNNTCPSHYGGGGHRIVLTEDEILQKEQEYYSGLNNYNNVEALYESLKDGGNTEQLQSEVATAWPSEMWALRAELLGKSPHLSKEVLMTAADKTDVLPESVIFEIMAANPDELRKEEIISYLENKNQPLPGYMIDILRQVANGVTYKTALKCQMSAYHSQKVNAANDIIRSILNDSISDSNTLRNWLDNIEGYEEDKQIIASYINEGNYASALNLIQLLPSLYELSGDQLSEYNQYKLFTEWLIGLYQQNRTVFGLDSLEIANLVSIAENGTGSAKYGTRGILEFAYGYHYCDCPELPEIAGLKNSKIDTDNVDNNFGLEIDVKPNPAKEWVAFDYCLPPGINTATLKITDLAGKVVAFINLTGNLGQHIWDSQKVNPGVYFYTINAGNAFESDKIIIE